jgi:futalosine hydrolase
MELLLGAATEAEIKPTLQFIEQHSLQKNISVVITGVGLLAATYHLTRAIFLNKPKLILQAGVAGCFDKKFPLGSVIVVENECMGDSGVEEAGKFVSLFDLKLIEENTKPWSGRRLRNHYTQLLQQTGLPVADGVTVNEISTHEARIDYYKNTLGATVETLEGAAVHYAGLSLNIPFLQLRSLSNFAGERNKEKWTLDVAIINLNTELQSLLLKLM